MALWSRLLRSHDGNVATLFALAVIPLMLAAGVAVDMVRVNQVRTTLQTAADSAALGGGASDRTNDSDIEGIAQKYLDAANLSEVVQEIKAVQIVNNSGSGTLSVRLTGVMKTSFMQLAGIPTLDIEVNSEVMRGTDAPMELVLALDNTASMAGSKLEALKTAAKNLAADVLAAGDKVKVGIVPFNDYVNVGLSRRGESWLRIGPETDETSCWNDYPNRSGCYMESGTCYNDGLPYSCQSEVCTDYGDPVQHCGVWEHRWQGCVASREPPNNVGIGNVASVPYDGLIDTWCARPVTELTSDGQAISDEIDEQFAYGSTFIPGGLLWGWNMLTSEAPLTGALPKAAIAAQGGKKALVLMTDGANTLYETEGSTVWGVHWGCDDCTATNELTAELCTNIKADGIILYTVLFEVTDPAIESLLHDCASDPQKSFVAEDEAALLTAFAHIGSSLSQLRISK